MFGQGRPGIDDVSKLGVTRRLSLSPRRRPFAVTPPRSPRKPCLLNVFRSSGRGSNTRRLVRSCSPPSLAGRHFGPARQAGDRTQTISFMLAQRASDRVASGRCRPEAPTDPYVLTLEHTVPQPTDSPSPKGPRGYPSESRGH